MREIEVLLVCNRCEARLKVRVHAKYDEDDGIWWIVRGTLNGDYVLRWARSHQEPKASVLSL